MKEYTDKQINSMIRHLKVKDIAEIQYIDNCDSGDLTYYDYKSNSHLTLSQLVASAIETGWKDKGEK